MPHPLELPRMLRAVVPLVGGERLAAFGRRIVSELIALALRRPGRGWFARRRSGLVPGFAPIVRALNNLPKPSAGLGRIQPIRIPGGSLEVIDLPARKMGAAYI